MPARADNFNLVGDAFAVGAAVFRLLGGDAITGSVPAFLGVGHDPPLLLRLVIEAISAHEFDAGLWAKDGIACQAG